MSDDRDAVTREELQKHIEALQALAVENAALKEQLAAALAKPVVASAGHHNQIATSGGIGAGDVSSSFLMTGGKLIGNVYLGAKTDNPTEALNIYREALLAGHSQVQLRGILPSTSEERRRRRPDLAEVYVALDTARGEQPPPLPWDRDRDRTPPRAGRRLSALNAAIRNRRMVLLGDPGSGKSTFITHLGLCLAANALYPDRGWLERLPGWPHDEGTVLPLPIALRDFARSSDLKDPTLETAPSVLWRFVVSQLERQNLGFVAKHLANALDTGQVLLMLDGLDEIPHADSRYRVRDAVVSFAQRYPRCRLVVTCRTRSYESSSASGRLDELPSFELVPFDDRQVAAFIRAWYGELERLGEVPAHEVEAKTLALQAAVQRTDIRRLAPNPLLLTVMSTFHAYRGSLPDQRAQIYEETISLLLWNREQFRASESGEEPLLRALLRAAGKTETDLYQVLSRRAYLVHLQDGHATGAADIAEGDLARDLMDIHPERSRTWAAEVIEAIRLRAGLLVERDRGLFAFPHRTFQEYLAGAHLAGLGDFAPEAMKLARRDIALAREILLLAVGKQVHVNREIDRPLYLVGLLCPVQASDTPEGWRLALLAGDVLAEIGAERARRAEQGEEPCRRVQDRLVALIEGNHLTTRERVRAGVVLAAIGDPRFGTSTDLCLPADATLGFTEVPSGEFLMGSDKTQVEQAFEDETPQQVVHLPGFLIARFPTTVAQFRLFLRAADATLADREGLSRLPTAPMTTVSLHEAFAYCDWLDHELRRLPRLPQRLARALDSGRVTLPTEAEWEKAARGDDGRLFPWGQAWSPESANTLDAGLSTTSPVGCFPSRRSPHGCDDMSGNIREWTRSPWARYPDLHGSSGRSVHDDGAVVRGASFLDDLTLARCACRYRNRADVRYYLLGFRVAISSIP